MRQTCSVLETNSTSVVLGATVGDDADIEESAAGICAWASEQKAMIATVDHAATELVLTRSCADVAELSYWLRCYGDVLGGGTADRFDRELRAALSGTLGGDISDTAWWQAGLGVDQGGLGFRLLPRSRSPRSSRVDWRPARRLITCAATCKKAPWARPTPCYTSTTPAPTRPSGSMWPHFPK